MAQITDHFSEEEMTHTGTGILNVPDEAAKANLKRLCADLGEPLHALWGVPIKVDSGFRSVAVNRAVKGSGWKAGQPLSAHVFGRAFDIVPDGLDLDAAFEKARISDLPYDKLMIEVKTHADGTVGRWIHGQISPSPDVAPRRLAFNAVVTAKGDAVYTPVK